MKGSFRKRGNAWSFTIDIGIDPTTGKRQQKVKVDLEQKRSPKCCCNNDYRDRERNIF